MPNKLNEIFMQIDEGWIVSSVDLAWNDPLFVIIVDLSRQLIG
jgi:hypothetical protein